MESNRKETLLFIVSLIVYLVISGIIGHNLTHIWSIIPFGGLLLVSFLLMKKQHSFEKYGFTGSRKIPYSNLLYLLPMFFVATVNLWRGAVLRYTAIETIFFIISMFSIGFIEEILFRGYLLKMLEKNSVKTAVIVSSVTFALGHILNLLSGAEFLSTMLQIIYALAIGLMLSVFVIRTKNIIPCCLFHGIFNSLSVFCNESGFTIGFHVISSAIISIICVGYAIYLWKLDFHDKQLSSNFNWKSN